MTPWFLLTLGTVVCLTVFLLLTKRMLSRQYDPFMYGGMMQITTGMLGLIALPFTGFWFAFTVQNCFYLLLTGITYACAASLYYWSMQHIDLSELTILESSGMIWGILLGLFVFSEHVTPLKIVSFCLILLAIFTVTSQNGFRIKPDKYRILALVSMVFYTVGAAFDKYLTGQSNPSSYLVLSFLAAGVTMTLVHRKRLLAAKNKLFETYDFPKQLLVNSSLVVIAYTMLYRAYALGGELSKITIILQTQTILVTLTGILLLHERSNIPRKIIAALLAFAGLWMVNI